MQDAQSDAIIKNGMFNLRVSSGCRCCYFSSCFLRTKKMSYYEKFLIKTNFQLNNFNLGIYSMTQKLHYDYKQVLLVCRM